jgi:hypothetical protein
VGASADRFGVSIPARAELIGSLRVFASTVARHYGLDEDGVENVKLAVSEAAAAAVDGDSAGRIDLAIDATPGSIDVRIVSGAWAESPWLSIDVPEGMDARSLDRFEVVRGLFADADRSESAGRVTVRFSTAPTAAG